MLGAMALTYNTTAQAVSSSKKAYKNRVDEDPDSGYRYTLDRTQLQAPPYSYLLPFSHPATTIFEEVPSPSRPHRPLRNRLHPHPLPPPHPRRRRPSPSAMPCTATYTLAAQAGKVC